MTTERAKTQRLKLTIPRINQLAPSPEKKTYYVFDAEQGGLSVRVTGRGAKAFVYSGKLRGVPIRLTIGDCGVWSIDDARREARRLQMIIDGGDDPREIIKERIAAKTAATAAQEAERLTRENEQRYTLKALCELYCDTLEAQGKVSARQARSILSVHVFNACPELSDKPAKAVTSHDIAAIVRRVVEAGKGRAAGVLRSYLNAAFTTARKAPFDPKIPSSFIAFNVGGNPVEVISTIAVNRGERTLAEIELRAYMAALTDDLPDRALRLALFAGGQRMAQLLRCKVSDYDATTKTLRLWDGKGRRLNAREHLIPLAPKGAALVEALIARALAIEDEAAKKAKREPNYTGLWLFSSFGKTALVETTPGKRVAAISNAMGGEVFGLRDVRRTVETFLAGMGISREARAQLLSHGLSGIQSMHYDKHTYTAEKRNALTAWEARLEQISTGQQVDNVVQMWGAA